MTEAGLQLSFAIDRPGFGLDVDLDLPMSGITGLFGASGAGKTTLLRLVAGLERGKRGRLAIGGDIIADEAAGIWCPPQAREIGYVFQEPRLFDHLDVLGNLVYGQRRKAAARDAVAFDQIIDILGLGELLARKPARLSGGEAQRVAIGRALLSAPKLVLMDEPLASLDTSRKDEILPFLDRLHTGLATPIIYVSHNIIEICRLCDQLVVLDGGKVVGHGGLQDVLVSMDVPQLVGPEAGSVIAGTVSAYDPDYDLTSIDFSGGEFRVPGHHGATGTKLRLHIHANDISLCREHPRETTILNVLDAQIEALEDVSGATCLVRLVIGKERLLARVTRRSSAELELQPGQSIVAQIKAVAVREP